MDDLAPLITRRSVLLIGELPGTREVPALVERLVDHAIRASIDVVVGFEIPMTESPNSGELGPFFSRTPELQDGRSSSAVAELVARLADRRSDLLHTGTGSLELVAMDGPWVAPGSPVPLELLSVVEQPRDEVMAGNLLRAMDAHPKAFTLVVAGPMHTRVDRSPDRTLGQLVAAWHPQTVSLRVVPAGGHTWILSDNGEGRVVELPTADAPAGALWAREAGADGHHGVLNPGWVSASHPLGS